MSFPQEIFDLIIDFVSDDSETISTCSLVSRAFLDSSRKHTFHNISFASFPADDAIDITVPRHRQRLTRLSNQRISNFLSFLSSPSSTPFAAYVRDLAIVYPFHDRDPCHEWDDAFVSKLQQLDGLRTLTLTNAWFNTSSKVVQMTSSAFRDLTSLHLHNARFAGTRRIPATPASSLDDWALLDLLYGLESLETLSIAGRYPGTTWCLATSGVAHAPWHLPRLRSLSITNEYYLPLITRGITSCPTTSLEKAHFGGIKSAESLGCIGEIVEHIGAIGKDSTGQIKDLGVYFDTISSAITDVETRSILDLSTLTSLINLQVSWPSPVYGSRPTCFPIFDTLPLILSLETLVIETRYCYSSELDFGQSDSDWSLLRDALNHSRFRTVRQITLYHAFDATAFDASQVEEFITNKLPELVEKGILKLELEEDWSFVP